MTWHDMKCKKWLLPGALGRILHRSLCDPLNVVAPGGLLYNTPIHHLAIALSAQKVQHWALKLEREHGLHPIEPLHLWPDEAPGCPTTLVEHQTVMASFQADGFRVVLLAPAHDRCVLARHLRKVGEGLHHVAFDVNEIAAKTAHLRALGLRQITELADDEPELKQVFFKQDPDPRIIELVERATLFDGTFKCGNIRTLIEGERRNAFVAPAHARSPE